ncbi:MAG: hypothetical protein Q9216_000650 [Gyalolechia sp. 2 TL-2023]
MPRALPVPQDEIVDLRWRDQQLSVREIFEKMAMVLVSLDYQAQTTVQLAESNSKNVVCLQRMGISSIWSFIRARKFIVREGTSKQMKKFLADFVHVGCHIMRILDSHKATTARNFQYVTTGGGKGRTKARMKQMWFNWAVTLEIHPLCLGINLDSTGVIVVPDGLRIEVRTRPSLLHREIVQKTLCHGRHPIPTNVQSINLSFRVQKYIRAVVVTEHRNINTELDGFSEHTRDVIIVMTAGYPCLATREFLRLLVDCTKIPHSKFLWVSDHDPHGFQVYTTLKFGSASMAWIAPSTCVPKLEFFGPTESQIQQVWDHQEAAKRRKIRVQEPSSSDEWVAMKAKQEMKSIRSNYRDLCRRKLKKNDNSILENLKNFRSMDSDSDLAKEVNDMIRNQCGVGHSPSWRLFSADMFLQKFAMSELDKISSGTVLLFILQAVDSFVVVEPN